MSKAGVDGLSLEHDRQPIARDPSAGSGRPAAPSVGVNRDTEQLAPTLKKEKMEIPPREIPPRGASPVKRGGTWKRVMYASTAGWWRPAWIMA